MLAAVARGGLKSIHSAGGGGASPSQKATVVQLWEDDEAIDGDRICGFTFVSS